MKTAILKLGLFLGAEFSMEEASSWLLLGLQAKQLSLPINPTWDYLALCSENCMISSTSIMVT